MQLLKEQTLLLDGRRQSGGIGRGASYNFESFIQRMKERNIPFTISSSGSVKVKLHSTSTDNGMNKWYYQIAYDKAGKFAIAKFKDSFQGTTSLMAQGLYNLESSKAGTRLTVLSGNGDNGDNLKNWSKTANNDNIWTVQQLILKYWSPQLSYADIKTIVAM